MARKKNFNNSGRKDAFHNTEIGERYISIWISKMYSKISDWDLAKQYDCSFSTIKRALEWVNKNFIKIPNKMILQGAIFAISERERHLTELIEKERAQEKPSIRSIVELNRELREDSRDRLKLQNLFVERYDVELSDGDGSIKAILQELTKK